MESNLYKAALKIERRPGYYPIDGQSFQVIPLYHPAACLYRPGLRVDLQNDFQIVKSEIEK